ncbi:MAG TPA: tetratricopeptide repeat protein, partial [Flavobacteriales bacterium]
MARALAVLLLVTLHSTLVTLQAQPGNYTTKDKKAIKHYENGAECMRMQDWKCAESDLLKAAQADPAFIEPRIYLAEMNEQRGDHARAMRYYKEVVTISPRYFPPALLHLADLELAAAEYDAAESHYLQFKGVEKDGARIARAQLGIENARFARNAVAHPVPFDPRNLGRNVNSAVGEYYPCITADDSTLIYTRRLKEPTVKPWGEQEDFMVSRRGADGAWRPAQPVPTVNTQQFNEGAGTLTPDGRFIVFTKCALADGTYGDGMKGFGSCDLF